MHELHQHNFPYSAVDVKPADPDYPEHPEKRRANALRQESTTSTLDSTSMLGTVSRCSATSSGLRSRWLSPRSETHAAPGTWLYGPVLPRFEGDNQ